MLKFTKNILVSVICSYLVWISEAKCSFQGLYNVLRYMKISFETEIVHLIAMYLISRVAAGSGHSLHK